MERTSDSRYALESYSICLVRNTWSMAYCAIFPSQTSYSEYIRNTCTLLFLDKVAYILQTTSVSFIPSQIFVCLKATIIGCCCCLQKGNYRYRRNGELFQQFKMYMKTGQHSKRWILMNYIINYSYWKCQIHL